MDFLDVTVTNTHGVYMKLIQTALQNDCKQIMGEIESKLHELHALTPVDNNPPSR